MEENVMLNKADLKDPLREMVNQLWQKWWEEGRTGRQLYVM